MLTLVREAIVGFSNVLALVYYDDILFVSPYTDELRQATEHCITLLMSRNLAIFRHKCQVEPVQALDWLGKRLQHRTERRERKNISCSFACLVPAPLFCVLVPTFHMQTNLLSPFVLLTYFIGTSLSIVLPPLLKWPTPLVLVLFAVGFWIKAI